VKAPEDTFRGFLLHSFFLLPRYLCSMSVGEIVLILFVYLLLFGAKGVPALAQTLGKAVYQFRKAARDVQNEIMQGTQEIRKQTSVKLDQLDLGLDDESPVSTPASAQPYRPQVPQSPAPPAEKPSQEPTQNG
jgi:sec-independent protein translocase protein TatA